MDPALAGRDEVIIADRSVRSAVKSRLSCLVVPARCARRTPSGTFAAGRPRAATCCLAAVVTTMDAPSGVRTRS